LALCILRPSALRSDLNLHIPLGLGDLHVGTLDAVVLCQVGENVVEEDVTDQVPIIDFDDAEIPDGRLEVLRTED
jgi:hypothetical protein